MSGNRATTQSNRGESIRQEKPMEKKAEQERERIEQEADEVDLAADESFPASDPPSFNPGVTGAAKADKKTRH